MESDTLAVLCDKKDILIIICHFYLDQQIILSENDCCKTCLSDIHIIFDRSLLDKTFLCCHEQIFAILIFLDRNCGRDLLFRHKLQKIDDRCSSCSPSRFRYLICLEAVYTSFICKEHDIVMTCSDEKFSYKVIFQSLHTLDAFASAVLALESIHAHSLYISHICDCDHNIFSRDKILHRYIELIISDMCSSVISVFFGNNKDFFFDNTEKEFAVCKDCFVLINFFHELCIFCFKFFSLQACQSSQTHIHDSLSLDI